MGERVGRWVVVATLDNGQTLTKQNKPHPTRTKKRDPEVVAMKRRRIERRIEGDQRAENRLVRAVLGVNVR